MDFAVKICGPGRKPVDSILRSSYIAKHLSENDNEGLLNLVKALPEKKIDPISSLNSINLELLPVSTRYKVADDVQKTIEFIMNSGEVMKEQNRKLIHAFDLLLNQCKSKNV